MSNMSNMAAENRGLAGLRVLSLESRRTEQMAKLIENHGGTPVSAPSMREIPIEENAAALAFAEDLLAGKFDAVIFLTGVGTRILFGAIETKHPRERLVEALSRALVVARGPKPVAALREFGVPIGISVPEPNTWRDILQALDAHQPPFPLRGKRIAVQEYGVSNREFLETLAASGALVTPVPVYQWALPEDLGPLRRAVDEIVKGKIDVLLVTSANQVHNLMQVAAEAGLAERVANGLRRAVIASIGPISTQALQSYGIAPDFEPSHPKMGQLVFEAAEKAKKLLDKKRESEPGA
ncbi:MAG: uroporphyrinogen-III synthase [Terriglobia bacterium]